MPSAMKIANFWNAPAVGSRIVCISAPRSTRQPPDSLAMANSSARSHERVATAPFCFGQILVREIPTGRFVLSHRDDETLDKLESFRSAEDAIDIAKYDDAGNYRPLKTAPNLRHGWRLELDSIEELRRALDYFYPGRLAVFGAWKSE